MRSERSFIRAIVAGVLLSMVSPGFGQTFLTVPSGINNRGQIVGYYHTTEFNPSHGFLLDRGVYTTIDRSGATSTTAHGIHDRGQILGHSDGVGFLLENGVFTDIVVPGVAASPAGINNRGDIVGGFSDATGLAHGFLLN